VFFPAISLSCLLFSSIAGVNADQSETITSDLIFSANLCVSSILSIQIKSDVLGGKLLLFLL